MLLVIGIFLSSIFFGLCHAKDSIVDKLAIGFRKFDEPITVGKEFLIYDGHKV